MTMHDDVAERLSEYLDEELTRDERQVVERHLAECEACRRTLDDLREIVETAGNLPPIEPERDLWNGIAGRMAGPSTRSHFEWARFARAGAKKSLQPGRRFAFTMPQLAAAGVLLAVLSGGLAVSIARRGQNPVQTGQIATAPASAPASGVSPTGGRPGDDMDAQLRPVNFDDPQYDAAVKDLQQTLERGRDKLDPATVAAVEQDLKIIDAAVADAQRALATDPANGYLSGYLVETRQRKLALLRQAAALTQDVM